MSKETLDDIKFKQMKDLKDVILAKKQGEALERASTGLTFDESISLGSFGHQAVYGLSIIHIHQQLIHSLTGYKGTILEQFVEDISRGSGSIAAKRLEKTLETVGQLGQYMPFQKHQIPNPTHLGAPDDG